MILRKLEQSEHGSTRPLWEEVFADDTKAFLDYYYYIKTKDNEIYVLEEDGRICSMLQLNPYVLKVEASELPSAYIIAVATKEEYRGRGYMGGLLRASLNEMYAEKIPFTFLMPAAEAIYSPYDFRFIYEQNIGKIRMESSCDETQSCPQNCVFSDAALWDAEEMARFFNAYFSGQWQVCAVRDAAYYQTMIMEQQSEKGGVRLIRQDGRSGECMPMLRKRGWRSVNHCICQAMKQPIAARCRNFSEDCRTGEEQTGQTGRPMSMHAATVRGAGRNR